MIFLHRWILSRFSSSQNRGKWLLKTAQPISLCYGTDLMKIRNWNRKEIESLGRTSLFSPHRWVEWKEILFYTNGERPSHSLLIINSFYRCDRTSSWDECVLLGDTAHLWQVTSGFHDHLELQLFLLEMSALLHLTAVMLQPPQFSFYVYARLSCKFFLAISLNI